MKSCCSVGKWSCKQGSVLTIVTRRVLLVPYNESLQSEFLMLNICAKNRAEMNGPHTVATAKQLFHRLLNDHTLYSRAVLDSRTREYMGHIFLSDLDETPELGYLFDKAYWGQGYASEAVGAFFNKAVKDLRLSRVKATSNVSHQASIRILEKIGFEKQRQHDDAFGPYFEFMFTSDEVEAESERHGIPA